MQVRTLEAPARLPEAGTANDRFKAGHQAAMHLSVFASVLIHLAIFLAWPHGGRPVELRGGLQGSGYLEVLTLAIDDDAPASAGAAPQLVETPDGTEVASGQDEGSEPGAPESAPVGWEHVPANLWRLAALRPELADSVRERDEEIGNAEEDSLDPTSEGTESQGLRIRLEAAELDLERLSEEERVSLERLSAYQPELVLSSPSSWLMLRNPQAVHEYMKSHLGDVGLRPGSTGAIGVAIWVDELGSVEWADVVHSSGSAGVDESALEMFRNVVSFRPARENGARVSVAAMYWLMW
jgi:TonB family protein